MPNSTYEALNLTYAESRKAKPRAVTGMKRVNNGAGNSGTEAKKAHLHWLHDKAVPDLDREIMKTNVLVDNILTEQTDLDTQMLAIRAMGGGEEAYKQAYSVHDGLRRAIAKCLSDTKRKRAKQFEAIRSMRTMMRTLVAEIDDNVDKRQPIQKSKYAMPGTNTTLFPTNTPQKYIMISVLLINLQGPNPRSLLRPEINRDINYCVGRPAPHAVLDQHRF